GRRGAGFAARVWRPRGGRRPVEGPARGGRQGAPRRRGGDGGGARRALLGGGGRDGRLAAGQQDDAGRRRLVGPAEALGEGGDGLGGRVDGLAGGRPFVEAQSVDRPDDGAAVRARCDEHGGGPRVGDQPQVDAGGEVAREGRGGFLGGLESGRRDVGRLHRQGHVDD